MSLSGKNRKKTKKFQKPKRCRQLPQHLIHTVFPIFHMENQDNHLLGTPTTENHKWLKVVGIKFSFEHVDSWAKSLLFRTHHLWNSTTELIKPKIIRLFFGAFKIGYTAQRLSHVCLTKSSMKSQMTFLNHHMGISMFQQFHKIFNQGLLP